MAAAIAVGAPSLRKPGSGFAPCEIGAPACRPLGVAPTALPIGIVLAHENRPGIRLNPAGVGFCLDQIGEGTPTMRSAYSSARDPPLP